MKEIELNQELSELKMKDSDSPSLLFTQIAGIENWYSGVLSKDKVIPALVQALPKECYKVAASDWCLKQIKSNNTNYSLDELEEQLMMLWKSLGGTNLASDNVKKKKNDESEVLLGSFDGVCYKCQKKGHKANRCPMKGSDNGQTKTGFSGACNLCGRKGHKKADCWEDPRNAAKRPKNYNAKSKIEKEKSEESGSLSLLMTIK